MKLVLPSLRHLQHWSLLKFANPSLVRNINSFRLPNSNYKIWTKKQTFQLGAGFLLGTGGFFVQQGVFAATVLFGSYGARGVYECHQKRHKQVIIKYDSWKVRLDSEKLSVNKEDDDMMERQNVSPLRSVVYGITGINWITTFAMQIPELRPFLTKYFMFSPVPGSSHMPSALLSTFLHGDYVHLFFSLNSMTLVHQLWSAIVPIAYIGKERHNAQDFLSLYMVSAVAANFIGLFIKTALRQKYSSYGASGALLSILAYIFNKFPNKQMKIFGSEDKVPFKKCFFLLLIVELIGIFLTVSGIVTAIDHPLHLGGLIFGFWFAIAGDALMRRWSDYVLENYRTHILKEPKESDNLLTKAADEIMKRIAI